MAASTWTSLEVAELVVAALIPLVVVLLGLLVNRSLIELRLDVHSKNWHDHFVDEDAPITSPVDIDARYKALKDAFAVSFGVQRASAAA